MYLKKKTMKPIKIDMIRGVKVPRNPMMISIDSFPLNLKCNSSSITQHRMASNTSQRHKIYCRLHVPHRAESNESVLSLAMETGLACKPSDLTSLNTAISYGEDPERLRGFLPEIVAKEKMQLLSPKFHHYYVESTPLDPIHVITKRLLPVEGKEFSD